MSTPMVQIKKVNQKIPKIKVKLNPAYFDCYWSDHLGQMGLFLARIRGAIRTTTFLASDNPADPVAPRDVIGFLDLIDEQLEIVHGGIKETCQALSKRATSNRQGTDNGGKGHGRQAA